MNRHRRWLPAVVLAATFALSGCATTHLVEWAQGEPSAYKFAQGRKDVYVRAGGTVLAFIPAVLFDVVTFPFQLIWSVYPYGSVNAPEEYLPGNEPKPDALFR